MELSVLGRLVKDEILKIPQYHKRCILDEWVVMPNHIHLLIELAGYNYDNGMAVNPDDDITTNNINATGNGGAVVDKIHEFYLRQQRQPAQQQPPTGKQNPDTVNDIKQYRKLRRQMIIPKILGKFQMITSKQINRERQTPGVKNWQNNYYDHVVRDEVSYQRIKQYIKNNPAKWNEDTFFER